MESLSSRSACTLRIADVLQQSRTDPRKAEPSTDVGDHRPGSIPPRTECLRCLLSRSTGSRQALQQRCSSDATDFPLANGLTLLVFKNDTDLNERCKFAGKCQLSLG